MIIDCGSCTVRGDACADCVVTFLTIPMRTTGIGGAGGAAPHADLDEAERRALEVLARSGLVPPLRLVRAG